MPCKYQSQPDSLNNRYLLRSKVISIILGTKFVHKNISYKMKIFQHWLDIFLPYSYSNLCVASISSFEMLKKSAT